MTPVHKKPRFGAGGHTIRQHGNLHKKGSIPLLARRGSQARNLQGRQRPRHEGRGLYQTLHDNLQADLNRKGGPPRMLAAALRIIRQTKGKRVHSLPLLYPRSCPFWLIKNPVVYLIYHRFSHFGYVGQTIEPGVRIAKHFAAANKEWNPLSGVVSFPGLAAVHHSHAHKVSKLPQLVHTAMASQREDPLTSWGVAILAIVSPPLGGGGFHNKGLGTRSLKWIKPLETFFIAQLKTASMELNTHQGRRLSNAPSSFGLNCENILTANLGHRTVQRIANNNIRHNNNNGGFGGVTDGVKVLNRLANLLPTAKLGIVNHITMRVPPLPFSPLTRLFEQVIFSLTGENVCAALSIISRPKNQFVLIPGTPQPPLSTQAANYIHVSLLRTRNGVLREFKGPVPPNAAALFPHPILPPPQQLQPPPISTPFILDFSFKPLDDITNEFIYQALKSSCSLLHKEEYWTPPIFRRQVHAQRLFSNTLYSNPKPFPPLNYSNCVCKHLPSSFSVQDESLVGRHVQSNSTSILPHLLRLRKFNAFNATVKKEVITMAEYGPKFRVNPHNTLAETRELLKCNLLSYLKRLHHTYQVNTSEWQDQAAAAFASEIVDKLRELSAPAHPEVVNTAFGHPPLSKAANDLWRLVGKMMVCTDVEKATHDYAFICPHRYVALIQTEIQQVQYTIKPDAFDSTTRFVSKETDYPLFASRTSQFATRGQARKATNAVVMKIPGIAPPPNPLTNACLRLASKVKFDYNSGVTKSVYRPISTGGNSVGSSGALAITDVFKLMDPDLDPLFRELYSIDPLTPRVSMAGPTKGTPFPFFSLAECHKLASFENGIWSSSNSSAIIAQIDRWNTHRHTHQRATDRTIPSTQTADFSKLYTMLSKADINIAVEFWVRKIFATKPGGEWGIELTLNSENLRYNAKWVLLGNAPGPLIPADDTNPRNNKKTIVFTAGEFLSELRFYLEHTYMWFNGKIVHQVDGIPMGTEFSVFLAQWVLAYYEFIFINELIFHKLWDLLKQFQHVNRYIDDIFAIDCPDLHTYSYSSHVHILDNGNVLQGIYPPSLTLNKEHSILNKVTGLATEIIPMLDMHICFNWVTDRLESRMFDKRQSLKLSLTPITKFALAESMMSEQMSINIMYSQCFRAFSVCHQWQHFASSCGDVLYELYMAGHSFKKLHTRMCRFFRKHVPLYSGTPNIHVHNLVRDTFEHHCAYGSPLLDHRNAWCGFTQRVTPLSRVYWPANPAV